ncbi:MAG TPA: hypothetical protein DCZ76_08660 [Treponema sp.]|nr:hypothetical protein [Treponema sp.]
MLTMAQVENQIKLFSLEEQLHLIAYIANMVNTPSSLQVPSEKNGSAKRLEGTMPLGVDGNLVFLPASLAVFTDDDGFAGGSISFGPGMGLSASTQKSATLSINSVMNFFNRKRK